MEGLSITESAGGVPPPIAGAPTSIALFAGWAPSNETLWAMLRRSVDAFMNGFYRQGAFRGTTPAQAYVVKCDASTTTQADIDRGVVNIVIGFAPLKPAEFVVITIAQLATTGSRASRLI